MALNYKLPATENLENKTWHFGYRKYGNTIIRFVSQESVDPGVLIEKHIEQTPWLRALVTGVDSEQGHFGIGYLEDTNYTPEETQLDFIKHQAAAGALALHEGVVFIENYIKSGSSKPSQPEPAQPTDENQLKLFPAS